MSVLRSRVSVPSFPSAGAVNLSVAAFGLLLLMTLTLGTPAFTDYEVETEPALLAFLSGHVGAAIDTLPIYGGSIFGLLPAAGIARLLGGGDLAVYRAVAIPGAIGVAWLATLAGRWLREAGADRRVQLVAVAALGLSPCVGLAWNYGHPEEPLIASLGIAGVLLAARDDDRSALLGGVLLGLAAAGKAWAVVLIPVGLVAAPTTRRALRVGSAAFVAGALVVVPLALANRTQFDTAALSAVGDVFTSGNLWWFLGAKNPAYVAPDAAKVITLFTTANSPRLSPAFAAAHARQLIVLVAVLLSATWWWMQRRRGQSMDAQQRLASILLLLAAVIWWRALIDPWFQAYYLVGALMAMVLCDARLGRLPLVGLVAWSAIWLLHGQNAPDMGLTADGQSALRLAWLVPMGLYLSIRAMRPTP